MTQPNLAKIAGHYEEGIKETPRTSGESFVGNDRRLPTKEGGRGPEALAFDAIQLPRALARWENEGGAGKYTLKRK